MRKTITLKKGVVEKSELPNIDEGLVKTTKGDVDNGHMLLAKCDNCSDWVFDSVRLYHIVETRACLQG